MTIRASQKKAKSVVVVGAGGNIGSHLVPHLGRMKNVERVTLIDRDVYETANLETQDITPRDVGRRKSVVQARRLSRINPGLRVTGIADAVEHVPLGRLRADVILACLDSRRSRAYVNQAAWRLGVPWIDTGVEAASLLARVNVYVPATNCACLECGWDEQDYRALEQAYPCQGFLEATFSTNAPSSLGALAASLQAIECAKVLSGKLEQAAVGQQVLIGAAHHKHYVTNYRLNPECRFYGHETWRIKKLRRHARELTIGRAIELGKSVRRARGSIGLRVEGDPFVRRLTCPNCGQTKELLRLQSRLRFSDERCVSCSQRMIASGRDLSERLEEKALPQSTLARSLHSLGFLAGDVFSVGGRTGELHFEIAVERV
ncbi:MAG TPA: ThiF family adenylyltransferase [Pyrinomonadaceae bacterium]|nr:ThiF family adenylyltransferase [Pyrinomonadaceae bacterium]